MLSHSTLRRRFHAACRKMGATAEQSVYRTTPTGFGDAFVEINPAGYHYVVEERGWECQRRTTADADELMYWLVCDVASDMASAFELRHRIPGQDCRRLLFRTRVDLLGRVNRGWAERRQRELDAILAVHPFRDNLPTRRRPAPGRGVAASRRVARGRRRSGES